MHRNILSLLRRLSAAVIATVIMVSLTACSKAPEEPTRPPHPSVTTPASTAPEQTTEPPITEPIPTQNTEPTLPKVEIDYNNLVTDAYMESIDGSSYCYHFPQFNLSGNMAQQVNQKIYEKCNNLLKENVYPYISGPCSIFLLRLAYDWGCTDDIASVVVANYFDYDIVEFDVYAISLDTGREASMDELLAEFGMDRDAFYNLVSERLKLYWDEFLADYEASGNPSIADHPFFQDRVKQTLSSQNIRNAVPYINANGGLSFAAEIYSMAGGDSYMHLINAYGNLEADYPKCAHSYASNSPSTTEDPLEYFIENCDSRYFTESDIQTFDLQMCLYARNAIYAKSGWIFSSTDLWNFFNRYSWYYPSVTAEMFTTNLLNDYQLANQELIVNYENSLKNVAQDALQYFIDNCDLRYFTAAEISTLDKESLLYARNAIYAKSGRMFNMEKLANFFSKYSWYTPTIPVEEFQENMLNKYQSANRDLILAREEELGGITAKDAYAIACRYWDYQEGDISDETGFPIYLFDEGMMEYNGTKYYSFRLLWLVTDESGSSQMSTLDHVYINAKTGACTYDIYS